MTIWGAVENISPVPNRASATQHGADSGVASGELASQRLGDLHNTVIDD